MAPSQLRILADENMPMVSEMFSSFGEVVLHSGRSIGAEDVKQTDILLVRSVTQVGCQLLQGSPVQFVGTATIGMDHIDTAYLNEHEITYSNAPGCNADAVVDYVLSCIFQLAEQQGFDPLDKTYGIVGVGNVGRRLNNRLRSAGCKVLLNDPPRSEKEDGFVSLEGLLEDSDVICVHTPLTTSGHYPTQHLLNESNLRALKSGAILINAGRGPVVDNAALLRLLEKRTDLSVVLDVWEYEPQIDKNLAEHCSIVSPHIAGYSLDGKIRGTFMLYQALCKHLCIAEKHCLEDFLPATVGPSISVVDLSPLQLMQQVYNPLIDDGLLRDTLALSEIQQMKEFDLLRKNYRIRRELSALSIDSHPQSKLLKALGFQLADNE